MILRPGRAGLSGPAWGLTTLYRTREEHLPVSFSFGDFWIFYREYYRLYLLIDLDGVRVPLLLAANQRREFMELGHCDWLSRKVGHGRRRGPLVYIMVKINVIYNRRPYFQFDISATRFLAFETLTKNRCTVFEYNNRLKAKFLKS